MAQIQSLLQQAAVIRDATADGENTALRVGSMFVSLILSIASTLPQEAIDAIGLTSAASATNFTISFKTVKDDGTTGFKQIVIPAASSEKAGLLTPAQIAEIQKSAQDISEALKSIEQLTPIRVESEEALDAMRTLGLLKDGQMYYIPEED